MAKYFRLSEFACNCCGVHRMDPDFVDTLDNIRIDADMPMVITSGYRCPKHNANVGGKATSAHTKGLAVDIDCTTSRMRFMILRAAIKHKVIRVGIAKDFIHLDMDPDLPSLVAWLY